MEGGYSEFWARKMRKVFNALDVEKNGYLTLTDMNLTAENFLKVCPKVDRQALLAQFEHTWRVLYNKGAKVSDDFRLSEQDFLNNMWYSVHQPNFKEEIRAMSKDVFKQMDLDKNNRLSKAEYVRQHSGRAGEAAAVAAFEAMDISKNGAVEFEELVNAKYFYYTDLGDESHPFNLMNGPLD